MFMRCRLTSRIIIELYSTTREEWVEEVLEVVEEVEDLVEVEEKLFVTTMEHRDTMHETVPTIPIHVSIVGLTIMLLKNALFCKLKCRTRDHIWVVRTSS